MRLIKGDLHIFAQVIHDFVLVIENFVQLGFHSQAQLVLLLSSLVQIVNLLSQISYNLPQVCEVGRTA